MMSHAVAGTNYLILQVTCALHTPTYNVCLYQYCEVFSCLSVSVSRLSGASRNMGGSRDTDTIPLIVLQFLTPSTIGLAQIH